MKDSKLLLICAVVIAVVVAVYFLFYKQNTMPLRPIRPVYPPDMPLTPIRPGNPNNDLIIPESLRLIVSPNSFKLEGRVTGEISNEWYSAECYVMNERTGEKSKFGGLVIYGLNFDMQADKFKYDRSDKICAYITLRSVDGTPSSAGTCIQEVYN